MKMVKSLLLGSAAGLVAVAGAQAADLPVKAKPVEYVKICSIYGAGFFYIPGTDTCIKIGGWVRAEYGFQTGNSSVQYSTGGGSRNNRIDSNEYNMRARWTTSIDVRTQTEYGTLRAYSRAGFQTTTGETTQGRIYTERGFIQFAGFTFGKSQSYFDFFGGAFCYGCSYTGAASMTGAAGTLLAAYTATFGNGFTATISLEDQYMRRNAIWDASNDATNVLLIGNMPGPATAQDSYNVAAVNHGDNAAVGIPDIVGSLRVDQAWGSAQIAGALHQLRAGYYGNNTTGAGGCIGTVHRQQPVQRRHRPGQPLPVSRRRVRLGRDGGYRRSTCRGRRATSSTLKPRSRKVPARMSAWTAASAARTTTSPGSTAGMWPLPGR